MGLFDIFIPGARRRKKLQAAVQSGDRHAMEEVFPLVFKTDLSRVEDLDCALDFLARFTRFAFAKPDEMFRALDHVAAGEALSSARRKALSNIYAVLTRSALKDGRRPLAIRFGLAGHRCKVLEASDRETILGVLVASRCDEEAVMVASRAALKGGAADSLTAAFLKASTCNLSSSLQQATSALRFAKLAVEMRPGAGWAYRHLGTALLLMNEAGEAAAVCERGLESLPGQPELKSLLAVAQFKAGRYAEVASTLEDVVVSKEIPDARLHAAAEAALFFCRPDSGECEFDADRIRHWARTLQAPHSSDGILGPDIPYVRGRLFALSGVLGKAVEAFEEAVAARPDSLYFYYAAHSLQLAGRWEDAGRLLAKATTGSEAIQCLRLRQALREGGGAFSEEEVMAESRVDESSPAPLARAKYALLTGRSVAQPDSELDGGREIREERLRLGLATALSARDFLGAQRLTQTTLFKALPSCERAHFLGAFLWLTGKTAKAEVLLARAAEGAPGLTGALKCLAAIKMSAGDAGSAVPFLEKVVERDPDDVQSGLRLAIAYERAERRGKAIAFLRELNERGGLSQQGGYLLGRLLLKDSFAQIEKMRNLPSAAEEVGRRARKRKSPRKTTHRWGEASKSAKDAFEQFAAIGEYADGQWYRWVCEVISAPPPNWKARATRWLDARPAGDHETTPPEARWLEALVKVSSDEFTVAIEGVESLASVTAAAGSREWAGDETKALWRVLRLASTPGDYARLRECVRGFAPHRPLNDKLVRPLLDAVAWRSLSGQESHEEVEQVLAEADLGEEERRLAWAILLLMRGEIDEASEIVRHRTGDFVHDAWFGLADALCSMANGSMEGVRECRKRTEQPETAAPWIVLDAAAQARLGGDRVVESLSELARISPARDGRLCYAPPLSGVLAYLAVNGPKKDRDRITGLLNQLTAEDLAGDSEVFQVFFRASAMLGEGEWALAVLEEDPGRAPDALKDEVKRTYHHLAARAIEESDYGKARDFLSESRARG